MKLSRIVGVLCVFGLAVAFHGLGASANPKPEEKKPVEKMTAFAKAMALGVDYYIGRLIRDRKYLNDEDWQLVSQLEAKIKAEGKANGVKNLANLDYKKFKKFNMRGFDDDVILSRTCVAAESINADMIGHASILCKRSLKAGATNTSFAMLGRGAKVLGLGSQNAIIAMGDFESEDPLSDTVIISGGNVKLGGGLTRLLVIASGKIELGRNVKCVVREDVKVITDELRFFSPDVLGLTVNASEKRLQVTKVRKDSAFAKAGFKSRDIILAIDGAKVELENDFRQLLLEAALANKGIFLLRRGNDEIKITVNFGILPGN